MVKKTKLDFWDIQVVYRNSLDSSSLNELIFVYLPYFVFAGSLKRTIVQGGAKERLPLCSPKQ